MNLDRVTITGADDSIHPQALADLSGDYPFVEWGILVSQRSTGRPRFPTHAWIAELLRIADRVPMQLSLHVCGRWVRRLLVGHDEIPDALCTPQFQRMQLNFHAENTPCDAESFLARLRDLSPRQFIFQIDGSGGNEHFDVAYQQGTGSIDPVPLFDISGGAGILPAEWPRPAHQRRYTYHGYAGGLGPENLERQIPLIAAAAGATPIWIDMETRVRSPDDQEFDFEKVERCLQIAKPFITATEPE